MALGSVSLSLLHSKIGRMKSVLLQLALGLATVAAPTSYAQVSASPSWVNFGSQLVGSSRSDSVWIQNRSGEDITNLRFWASGDRSQFDFNDIGCGYLRKDSSCTLYIYYRPNREGRHRLDLSANGSWGYINIQAQGQAYVQP
jgi:hypothetical protein